jgi:hypothetical protein
MAVIHSARARERARRSSLKAPRALARAAARGRLAAAAAAFAGSGVPALVIPLINRGEAVDLLTAEFKT